MGKKYHSVEEQVQILRSRGLVIEKEDENKVINILTEFGYYEIINGHKAPFIDPNDPNGKKFVPNTKFSDLYSLFSLDQTLRDAVMQSVEMFELTLRQAIASSWSKTYGTNQNSFLDTKNFRSPRNNPSKLNRLIGEFAKIVYVQEGEPFKHYRKTHHNITPWILVKALDFGTLRAWYTLLLPEVKEQVLDVMYSDRYAEISKYSERTKLFGGGLELTNKFRNRAAHGGQIYSFAPRRLDGKPIIEYAEAFHNDNGISKKEYDNGYGQTGLWMLATFFGSLRFQRAFNVLNNVNEKYTNPTIARLPLLSDYLIDILKVPESMQSIH